MAWMVWAGPRFGRGLDGLEAWSGETGSRAWRIWGGA